MMVPVVQNNMTEDDAVCRDGSIPMMVMHACMHIGGDDT